MPIKVLSFRGLDDKRYKLSRQEKAFCDAYLETLGDSKLAVKTAGFDVQNPIQKGKRLLMNRNCIAYLQKITKETGFSEQNVENQHLYLINQFADLPTKMRAIESFYRITGKYEDTLKLKFMRDENEHITDAELQAELLRRSRNGELVEKLPTSEDTESS